MKKLMAALAGGTLLVAGCTAKEEVKPYSICTEYDAEAPGTDGRDYECKYIDQSEGTLKWVLDDEDEAHSAPVVIPGGSSYKTKPVAKKTTASAPKQKTSSFGFKSGRRK